MNISRFAFACLAVAAFVACSDGASSSSGGTSGGSISGLPSNKKLSEVSDADMVAACNANKTATPALTKEESKKVGCALSSQFSVLGAKTDAEAQAQCKTAYDACMAKADPAPTEDACAEQKVNPKWKDCQATVSEYDVCVNDQLTALKAYATFDCKDVKVGQSPTTTPTSTACKALEEKCPGSVDGT